MVRRKNSGQILILVLLIVVVALAIGLSVASRNITNLRTATQTEQSQRAFSAAEGGVEDTLSKLGSSEFSSLTVGNTVNKNIAVGDLTANVAVTAANVYERVKSPLTQGEVGQIFLEGASGNLKIDWVNTATEGSTPASLYVSLVSGTNTSNYAISRTLYSGGWAGGDSANETGSVASQEGTGPGTCTPSVGFSKCVTVPLPANPRYMRIRPFWNIASLRVSGGTNMPIQTYEIVSSASTINGVNREVKVVRTAYPVLPAAFDYAIFSEGGINK